MVWPLTQLPLVGEIYVRGEGYRDISADIRLSSADSGGGVGITRGRQDAGTRAENSKASITINNRHGKYSPRNKRSELFGLIGKNTPARLGLTTLSDPFARTTTGGWGASPSVTEAMMGNISWLHPSGGGADYAVTSGQATQRHAAVNQVRRSTLDTALIDPEQVTDIKVSAAMVGASCVTGHLHRYNSANGDAYWLRVEFNVGGTVTLKISRWNGATLVEIASLLTSLAYTSTTVIRLRSAVAGRWQGVKAWIPATQPEPVHWMLTAEDPTLTRAGRPGLMSWLVGGNTNTLPVTVSYANHQIINRRFTGEVPSWPPRWDLSGQDRWVPLKLAGVKKRLNQGPKPVRTPIEVYLKQFYTPVGYWRMDDNGSAALAASAVDGPHPYPAHVANIDFGLGDGSLPGAAKTARMRASSSFQGNSSSRYEPSTPIANWSLIFFFKLNAVPAAKTQLVLVDAAGTGTLWEVYADATNWGINVYSAAGALLDGTTSPVTIPDPTEWNQLHLWVNNDVLNPGNVHAELFVAPVFGELFTNIGGSGIDFAGTVGAPNVVRWSGSAGLVDASYAHMFLTHDDVPFLVTDFINAARGLGGEDAIVRMRRQAVDQGISLTVLDHPVPESVPVGPQPIAKFLEGINETADAEGGILHEPRHSIGLLYRTRLSMVNQTPLDLSYTGGFISEPFQPDDDDRESPNDVTVTRKDGTSSRVQQLKGPNSVLAPEDGGIGPYPATPTFNLGLDLQPLHRAGWEVLQGAWDGFRFSAVSIDLSARAYAQNPAIAEQASALDSGDVFRVTGLPDWLPDPTALIMVEGHTETLDAFDWDISFNGSPGGPWTTAIEGRDRFSGPGTVTATLVTTASTTMQITTAGPQRWATAAGQFPMNVIVGADEVVLSGITGGGATQTANIASGITRTWAIGTEVRVAGPVHAGRIGDIRVPVFGEEP